MKSTSYRTVFGSLLSSRVLIFFVVFLKIWRIQKRGVFSSMVGLKIIWDDDGLKKRLNNVLFPLEEYFIKIF